MTVGAPEEVEGTVEVLANTAILGLEHAAMVSAIRRRQPSAVAGLIAAVPACACLTAWCSRTQLAW